jgi:cobalt-zinc-cadmium efflux system protein
LRRLDAVSHDHPAHAGHASSGTRSGRAFAIGAALNLAFLLAEVVAGFVAHSVALFADAGHNLSDLLGLGLAWGATLLATRPPRGRFTYGLRSSTIWAAFANAAALLIAVGAIALEAVQRLAHPVAVEGGVVALVAFAGVIVNAATAALFARGKDHDLNLRGVFVHMSADAAVSLGVALGGVAILWTGQAWIDPAISLVVAVFIVWAAWGVLRESLSLALHSVPRSIELSAVRAYLGALPGVRSVHDLHVWAMSTSETALTAHLVVPQGQLGDALLARACRELAERFAIGHATLQVESGDPAHPCRLEPEETV